MTLGHSLGIDLCTPFTDTDWHKHTICVYVCCVCMYMYVWKTREKYFVQLAPVSFFVFMIYILYLNFIRPFFTLHPYIKRVKIKYVLTLYIYIYCIQYSCTNILYPN